MVSKGDRIELVHTTDEYTKLKSGNRGTVRDVTKMPASICRGNRPRRKIHVDWDTGSSLSLIAGEDSFKVVEGDS